MAEGFGRPAGGTGSGMPQHTQRLQEQVRDTQAQLAEEIVSAAAGGGAVKVTMTGDQKCRAVEISADVVKEADPETLQDLILSAVNLALERSRALASERLGPLTSGLPL